MYLNTIIVITLTVSHLTLAESDRQKRSDVGVESCMQIYSVPKKTVVCEPSQEVKDAIEGLSSKNEEIMGNIDGLNVRLDEIDPTIPKDIPQDVKDRLGDIDQMKQTQISQAEIIKRFESEINSTIRRLFEVESNDRGEIRQLIEQQSLLIKVTLEKTNISLHDQYVGKLTDTAHDLLTKLKELEIELKDRLLNNSNEFYTRIYNQDTKTRDEILEIKRNLENSLTELYSRVDLETNDRHYYYNLSVNHGDVVQSLKTTLTSLRENQAKSVTKENELQQQVNQLQENSANEHASHLDLVQNVNDLQPIVTKMTTHVQQWKDEAYKCCNETALLREDLNKVIEEMKRRAHLLPRTLKIQDCQDVLRFYYPNSGVYDINPNPTTRPTEVFCDLSEDDGWTVIQRRQDGNANFYQNWEAYKVGFGDVTKEYWLGLQYIHTLTTAKEYTLRIELQDWDGNWQWAQYDQFSVDGEDKKYQLHVKGYTGNAGDSLSYHNNMPFSTKDNNNDLSTKEECSEVSHGAWWYESCYQSNLNGRYYNHGEYTTSTNYGDGVVWMTYRKTNYYSMKSSIMKIKPKISYV